MSRQNTYIDDREHLRQLRRKTETMWEMYFGKKGLLDTYEQLGIHNAYTDKLRRVVNLTKKYLVNRGEF